MKRCRQCKLPLPSGHRTTCWRCAAFAYWEWYGAHGTSAIRVQIENLIVPDGDARRFVTHAHDAAQCLSVLRDHYKLPPDTFFFDAFACMGGDTLMLLSHFQRGCACEIDLTRWRALRHNTSDSVVTTNSGHAARDIITMNTDAAHGLQWCAKLGLFEGSQWIAYLDPPWEWWTSGKHIANTMHNIIDTIFTIDECPTVIIVKSPPKNSTFQEFFDLELRQYAYYKTYTLDIFKNRDSNERTTMSILFYTSQRERYDANDHDRFPIFDI